MEAVRAVADLGRRGVPVAFAGCVGFLHPGERGTGILFCAPWGFEDLSGRKSWRLLAEQISGAGFPCLRFDYPGTGDSLGSSQDVAGLETWLAAIREAAGELRRHAGVERLVLLGQGLGAALACLALGDLPQASGLVLMAPVTKGRRHLRQLAAWEQMIAGSMGYRSDPGSDGAVSVAGFTLSGPLAAAISRIDLAAAEMPGLRDALIAAPAQDAAMAEAFAARLRDAGIDVTTLPFVGYEALVADPMSSVTPWPVFREVVAWLEATCREEPAPPMRATSRPMPAASRPMPAACRPMPAPAIPVPLAGEGFRERTVAFGDDGGLVGILCEPAGPAGGKARDAALLVNTGSDHHIGWGRIAVEQARCLAVQGIASLRFDTAGIGDSPARPDTPAEVIYSDGQLPDAVAAMTCLQEAGYPRATVIGRCSGAYLALNLALADDRVKGLVLVDLRRLVWDPSQSVEDALRHIPRSLDAYGSRLRDPETWARIRRGEVDLRAAASNLARQLAIRLAPRLARGRGWSRLHDEAHRRLRALRNRDVPVTLVYSEGDLALDEYAAHLGARGQKLRHYPNIRVATVAGADHNFTPEPAKSELLALVCRAFEPGPVPA